MLVIAREGLRSVELVSPESELYGRLVHIWRPGLYKEEIRTIILLISMISRQTTRHECEIDKEQRHILSENRGRRGGSNIP